MLCKLFHSKAAMVAGGFTVDDYITLNADDAKAAILEEAKSIVSKQESVRLGILRNYSARSILG